MKRNNLLLISVVVILGLFALAATLMNSQKQSQVSRIPVEKLVKDYSPKIGNPMAKVTIVEFLDPECESCAAFFPTVKGLVNDYKDQVQFVVRYMLFHGSSEVAAMATEAAGKQGKYWEMQGQLFHRAHEWSHQETPPVVVFETIAAELGLNLEKFRQDMKDPQTLANIRADHQEGPTIGVTGTPTIFVNGRMLTELSYNALKSLIEEELKAP